MILVEPNGGLGNQMFQFSMGYVLSKKYNVPLVIRDEIFHIYHEEISKIFPNAIFYIATQKQIDWFLRRKMRNLIKKILQLPWYKIYKERDLNYDPNIFQIKPPLMIKGFWQSEKYFKGYESQIKHAFEFNQKIDNLTCLYQKKIKGSVNSVALHVRRGDYILNPQNFHRHGICTIEYYSKSITIMIDLLKNPFFFVFSDDHEWVKQNIIKQYPNTMLVETENSNYNSWKDMYLMSICDHQIIANSTFSWWAAWLNQSPNKYVIAPRQWFQDENLNKQTNDLIPENWIRI